MRLFALLLLCLTLSTVQGRVASVAHAADKLPHATESADSPSPHAQAARVPLAVAAAHSETLAVTVPTDNAHTTQTATPAGKTALRELQGRRPGGWGLLGVAKDLASGGAVFLQQLATGSVGNPFLDSPQYAPVGPLRKGPPRVIKNPFAEGKSVLGIQPGPRG